MKQSLLLAIILSCSDKHFIELDEDAKIGDLFRKKRRFQASGLLTVTG
jgi:hypothetical protein